MACFGTIFAEGDLVLIAEDDIPPLRWQMARIEKLYTGNDDISRVVKLKTSNGNLIRPVVKIRRLPIQNANQSSALVTLADINS